MSDTPRLGVPENGRTLARTCATVLTTYQNELRSALDWLDQQELTVSSLENFCVRVRRVSDALGDEAGVLERRAHLRDASLPELPPLLGFHVRGEDGIELHPFTHRTTTRAAVSVLEERDGGPRKDGS